MGRVKFIAATLIVSAPAFTQATGVPRKVGCRSPQYGLCFSSAQKSPREGKGLCCAFAPEASRLMLLCDSCSNSTFSYSFSDLFSLISVFVKLFLAIAAILLIAVSLFADYKWRRWIDNRRRDREKPDP